MPGSKDSEKGALGGRPRNESVRLLLKGFCQELIDTLELKLGDRFPSCQEVRSRFLGRYQENFNDDVFGDVMKMLSEGSGATLAPSVGKRKRYFIKNVPTGLSTTVAGGVEFGIGFSSTSLDVLEQIGIDKIRSVKYNENWFDSVDRSSLLFSRFQGILESAIADNRKIRFEVILQNANFLAPKIQRVTGMSPHYIKHCAELSDTIAGNPDFDLSETPVPLSTDVRALRESLFDRVSAVVHKLHDDYMSVQSLASKAYIVNQAKENTEQLSVTVRAYRSWQSFPCLIVNDEVAVLGFYPSSQWANDVPAICARSSNVREQPLVAMAISDFQASWNQSIVVFNSVDLAPDIRGKLNSYVTVFGEESLRTLQIDPALIRERIAILLNNFAKPHKRARPDAFDD